MSEGPAGKFRVGRVTDKKRMRAKRRSVKAEMRRRMHLPIPQQGAWLRSVLEGHLNYYAVPGNSRAIGAFRHQIARDWCWTLRRRSQRSRMTWQRMRRHTANIEGWAERAHGGSVRAWPACSVGVWSRDRHIGSQVTRPPWSGVVDREIARRAARQHGVLTRAQLLEVGLTAEAIDHRLQRGRLARMHRGVYGIGHLPSSLLARAAAAVLACGPGTAISHRTAALIRLMIKRWGGPIEVIAREQHRLRGVIVHRSCTLAARDVRRLEGIPVTTAARTLLDLADVLDERALTRAVNEARVKRLLTLDELADLLARSPGRRATKRLRPFVDARHRPTRSVLEDDFLRFVDRYGLPRPKINDKVAGYEVDAVWPDRMRCSPHGPLRSDRRGREPARGARPRSSS